MAMPNTYARGAACLPDVRRSRGSQDTEDPHRRQWTSRAGWKPGLAAPLFSAGELTSSILQEGAACLTSQRRQAQCSLEYYLALLAYCQQGRQLTAGDKSVPAVLRQWRETLHASAADPDNPALREQAMAGASALSGALNQLGDSYNRAARTAGMEAAESVRLVNYHLETLAGWNRAISVHLKTHGEAPPGSIMQERLAARESALDALFRYIDIDIEEKHSGSLIVSMHGANLVFFDRRAEYVPSHAHLAPLAGILAAQIQARDKLFPQARAHLDAWIRDFSQAFNQLYSTAPPGGDGQPPGHGLFNLDEACRLTLHPELADAPLQFEPRAGRWAMLSWDEKDRSPPFDQLFTDRINEIEKKKDLAADIGERIAWQEQVLASGCGEAELTRLINCQKAFLTVYERSGAAEQTYGKLVRDGM